MDSNDGTNDHGIATLTETAATVGLDRPDPSDLPPLDEIAATIGDLPDIALRVLRLTDGEDWSGADLAEEICRDPGLTARFLRAANSAHYGVRRTISSPSQALTMLGSKLRLARIIRKGSDFGSQDGVIVSRTKDRTLPLSSAGHVGRKIGRMARCERPAGQLRRGRSREAR